MKTRYTVGQIIISKYDNKPMILKQYTDEDYETAMSRRARPNTHPACRMCVFSNIEGSCMENKLKHLGKDPGGCHCLLTPNGTYFERLEGGI